MKDQDKINTKIISNKVCNTKNIIYFRDVITKEKQDYKLKISSKKLKSGKCQIKFEFVQADIPSFYGYILAEGKTPLREVITTIYERTKSINVGDYFHDHLYHIQERKSPQHHLFLFKN